MSRIFTSNVAPHKIQQLELILYILVGFHAMSVRLRSTAQLKRITKWVSRFQMLSNCSSASIMHTRNTAFRFTRLPTSPNSPNTNVTDIHHDLQVLHFTVERGPPQKS